MILYILADKVILATSVYKSCKLYFLKVKYPKLEASRELREILLTVTAIKDVLQRHFTYIPIWPPFFGLQAEEGFLY